MGIGDWGLGHGPKTPKPKPQTQKPKTHNLIKKKKI